MKRNLSKAIWLCIPFLGTSLFAQNKFKLSLDTGYTYSILNANLSNLVDAKYSSKYGFGANLTGEYLIWNSLFVSTGISFIQKKYEFERTGSREGWYTKYSNDFLSFPLLVGGYVLNNPHESKGVWIKLAGGMYLDYWLKMRRDGRYPVFNEAESDGSYGYTTVSDTYDFKKNENQLKRFGYGLQGQAQIGYSFDKIDVYGAYDYQYGLSDISKTNMDKNQEMKISSYMISVGAAYKLN